MQPQQHQQLITAALQARQQAYAPYSNFAVGAALLDEAGRIFIGCNVENASYGLTICAERVAVGQAVAAGARRFTGLAIAAAPLGSPCGACRQVLIEFGTDLRVLLVDADNPQHVEQTQLDLLLPGAFTYPPR